jgi:hypothetical protein
VGVSAKLTPEPERIIDGEAIGAALDRKSKAALKRFGAFVRRRMQTSIRYRKKKSEPGQTPSARRGTITRLKFSKKTGTSSRQAFSPLRELITFAVSEDGRSVIIGPMIFRASRVGGGVAPQRLEEGGTGEFFVNKKRKPNLKRVGNWKPRPFAAPAFRAELPSAPKLFGGGQ